MDSYDQWHELVKSIRETGPRLQALRQKSASIERQIAADTAAIQQTIDVLNAEIAKIGRVLRETVQFMTPEERDSVSPCAGDILRIANQHAQRKAEELREKVRRIERTGRERIARVESTIANLTQEAEANYERAEVLREEIRQQQEAEERRQGIKDQEAREWLSAPQSAKLSAVEEVARQEAKLQARLAEIRARSAAEDESAAGGRRCRARK